jgi:hypothetical protein
MDSGTDKRVTRLAHDEDKRFGRLDHTLEVILEVIQQGQSSETTQQFLSCDGEGTPLLEKCILEICEGQVAKEAPSLSAAAWYPRPYSIQPFSSKNCLGVRRPIRGRHIRPSELSTSL